MAADPLAPFRREGSSPAAPPPRKAPAAAIEEPTGYRAFAAESGGKPLRLELRPVGGLAIARYYAALTEIIYDRARYEGIWLAFGQSRVALKGSGLRPLVEALLAGTCAWIAEREEGEQAPPGAPVVTEMSTKTGGG